MSIISITQGKSSWFSTGAILSSSSSAYSRFTSIISKRGSDLSSTGRITSLGHSIESTRFRFSSGNKRRFMIRQIVLIPIVWHPLLSRDIDFLSEEAAKKLFVAAKKIAFIFVWAGGNRVDFQIMQTAIPPGNIQKLLPSTQFNIWPLSIVFACNAEVAENVQFQKDLKFFVVFLLSSAIELKVIKKGNSSAIEADEKE